MIEDTIQPSESVDELQELLARSERYTQSQEYSIAELKAALVIKDAEILRLQDPWLNFKILVRNFIRNHWPRKHFRNFYHNHFYDRVDEHGPWPNFTSQIKTWKKTLR